MPNPYEQLTAFFKTVGLAELQLESMRVQCYMHRGFNVVGAFAMLDYRQRGIVEPEDLQEFMPARQHFSKEEAPYAIAAVAPHRKLYFTEEQFASIFQGDDRQMCQKVLARQASLLGKAELDLLARLLKILAKIGRVLEQTKQDMQVWSVGELFAALDSDQKGCVNAAWIHTFLMVNGLTDEDILRGVDLYLKRRGTLVIFPATLESVLQPVLPSLKRCRSAEPSIPELPCDNIKWRLQLEQHQEARMKILNEVAERSARKWRSPEPLLAIHLEQSQQKFSIPAGSTNHWRAVGDRCDALQNKIRELKRKLANDSDRHVPIQSKLVSDRRLRDLSRTSSSWKKNQQSTSSSWKARQVSQEDLSAKREARLRINEIQELAKEKLRTNRSEFALEQLLIAKCEELDESNTQRILLERELNLTNRKVQKLEKDVIRLSHSSDAEPPMPITRHKHATGQQFRRKPAADPSRLNQKARHIDMEFERLRQRLESERRHRRT